MLGYRIISAEDSFSVIRFTINVKVKLKVKFTLEKATKAQTGSRGIALYFPFNLGAR
jgi:hypothetical protein